MPRAKRSYCPGSGRRIPQESEAARAFYIWPTGRPLCPECGQPVRIWVAHPRGSGEVLKYAEHVKRSLLPPNREALEAWTGAAQDWQPAGEVR